MFILSASASNQSAYEFSRYSQGLLTYALLKAIKQQPDILEDGKYLNLSRWFGAAEKTVSDLASENHQRQQPQIATSGNCNIGIVDDEVMRSIHLPEEKPLFTASNFQNSDPRITEDDMGITKYINYQLSDVATRGTDGGIAYNPNTNMPEAWTLSGRYTVNENSIIVNVNIRRNNEKYSIKVTGSKTNLNDLAEQVVKEVLRKIPKK